MKKFIILITSIIIFQSCIKKIDPKKNNPQDFKIQLHKNYNFNNEIFKDFVIKFIALPSNKKIEIFTLYIDERSDTLLFTISKYWDGKFDLNNSLGCFYCAGKAIIIYSPFNKFIEVDKNQIEEQKILELFTKESLYFKNHKKESVMWQLQIPFYNNSFYIQKDENKILNTIKVPMPNKYRSRVKY